MIFNLTQHPASQEQLAAGVVDLHGPARDLLIAALTVDTLPTRDEIEHRAAKIANMMSVLRNPDYSTGCTVMIGGAPWMMSALEHQLHIRGINAVYAFSVRESVESVQADGSVRKTAVFRHAGFIPAIQDTVPPVSAPPPSECERLPTFLTSAVG